MLSQLHGIAIINTTDPWLLSCGIACIVMADVRGWPRRAAEMGLSSGKEESAIMLCLF